MSFEVRHNDYIKKTLIRNKSRFRELVKDIARLVHTLDSGEVFKFASYKIAGKVDGLISDYRNSLYNDIIKGIGNSFELSKEKNSKIESKNVKYAEINIKDYEKRKFNRLTISDRVWRNSAYVRDSLEKAIDLSLKKGQPANELAREITKYLNNPKGLKKDYSDKHPSMRGVYRDPFKNAQRLAANEINIAYRRADVQRWRKNSDVVGYEVRLSNRHKVYDMCDDLKGSYPKGFEYTQWHVNCRCFAVPILKTDEEFIEELNSGEVVQSKNEVKDIPDNVMKWIDDNSEMLRRRKNLPMWMQDNKLKA